MGKIWDLLNSHSWEEYQRIQLYRKIGNKLEGTTKKEIPKKKLRKKENDDDNLDFDVSQIDVFGKIKKAFGKK